MKKLVISMMIFISLMSCKKVSTEKLSTELFNFSTQVVDYMKPLEALSKLASIDNEVVLVTAKDFSVTNKFVIPFLHYQLSLNNVNSADITKERIEEFMYLYAYIFAKNEIIAREAIEKGIVISDEEVEKSIAMNTQGRLDEFKEFIGTTALSYDFYLKDTKQSLLIAEYEKSLIGDITVSEDEKKEYFLKDSTISKTNPKVSLRNITVNFKPGSSKDKALVKITKILKDIKKGNDFAEVAKKMSDDVSTKSAGGMMGDFVSRGDLEPALELVAFSTPIGEVSEIVELPNSYQIIKVEKIDSEGVVEYNDIAETIGNILSYMKRENIVKEDTDRVIAKYGLRYWKI